MAIIVRLENLSGMNMATEFVDVKEYEAYKWDFYMYVFRHSSILKSVCTQSHSWLV